MANFIKKHKKEIGLSPDDLFFRGENIQSEIGLNLIDFNTVKFLEKELKDLADIRAYKNNESVTWLNVDGLHNTHLLQEIIEALDIEPMAIAEVLNTSARPKFIEFDSCILVSAKMIFQEEGEGGKVSVENLSLILTDSFLISFQERQGDVFEPIRERIRKQRKRVRQGGTDYLLFSLLDIVIDNYLYVLSELGEKIDNLEDQLLDQPGQAVIKEINKYKRDLNFMRKSIKPAKEMIFALAKLDSNLISDSSSLHFKELQDNISPASEATDNYRDVLSDQLNIYHTTISSKLNDTMKFLTVFSVVFIPLTFIAGIYGTNFDNVPELHYKYGYFVMLAIMVLVALGMLYYFKRRKWL
jgi:magnesium transporter